MQANTNDELQSPEIQTMYSLNMPVSAIRTKIRQEFEKHRYVSQLSVVDVLLYQSHAEFQVSSYRYPSAEITSRSGQLSIGGFKNPCVLCPLDLYPQTSTMTSAIAPL